MKKALLTLCACALGLGAFSQTTLLSQDYNTTDFNDYTLASGLTSDNTSLVNNISTVTTVNTYSTATTGTANDGVTSFSLTGSKLKLERTGARTGGIFVRSTSFDGINSGGGTTDFIKLSAKVEFLSTGTAGTAAEGAPIYFVLGNSFGTSVQAGGLGRNANNDNNAQIAVQVALVPSRDASNVTSFVVEVPTGIQDNSSAPTFTPTRSTTPYTGEHTLTIIANNVKSSSIIYTAPDGVTSKTLLPFTYDVYIDNTLVHNGIAVNPNARQETATDPLIPKGISPIGSLKIALNAAANNAGAQNAGKVSFTMDDLLVTRPLATLPVSLTSFTGETLNTGVRLAWSTVSEQNNDRFEVLRSTDGVSFANIGNVKGNGNSSLTKNYTFLDRSPVSGTNYYKLNQVDFNGVSKQYGPVAVKYGVSDDALTVYATSFSLTANTVWDKTAVADLIVIDLSGKQVFKKSVNLVNGTNDVSVNNLNLKEGVYILQVSDGRKAQTVKFRL